jgi:hypothetical protein
MLGSKTRDNMDTDHIALEAAEAYFKGLIDAKTRAKELAPYIKSAIEKARELWEDEIVQAFGGWPRE